MTFAVAGIWRPTIAAGAAAFLLCVVAPRSAAAQAPSPSAGTEIGGLVDVYYDYYSTRPVDDAVYRNYDTRHNQFALSMAEVWVGRAPTADSRAGFKVRLNFGPASTNFIHATEPGGSAFQNIQEAYASYLAPAGRGLQIDAGIFVTPAGAEVIEAKDDYNYSRALLFVLAVPGYHAGVRMSYSPSDKVTLTGGLVNGWNDVVDNNTGKTLMAGMTLKPTSAVTLVQNYIAGPETAGTNENWRHLSDTILTYAATPKLSLIGNYDYGRDTGAHWQAVAAYLKYQATSVVALSPRFEYYDDASGFTTGTAQRLREVTGTIEIKAAENLLWRVEYRGDVSDRAVFPSSNRPAPGKHQQSVAFGLLYSFSSKLP